MAGGVGGFAEGFSGGLGQGMGIINQVRANQRADRAEALNEESTRHAMGIQDAENARAQTAADQNSERFTHEKGNWAQSDELLKYQVQDAKTMVETHGVELGMKQYLQKYYPDLVKAQVETAQGEAEGVKLRNAGQKTANASAELNLKWEPKFKEQQYQQGQQSLAAGNLQIKSGQLQYGASLMQSASALQAAGIPVPPEMLGALKDTPFNFPALAETARAAQAAPKIGEMAAKGDFSFMQDGTMRESAFSLARATGQRAALQTGLDPATARVVEIRPNGKGTMLVRVTARDPKSGAFRNVNYTTKMDALAKDMQHTAAFGTALNNNPQTAEILQAYAGASSSDPAGTAAKAWADNYDRYQKVVSDAGPNDHSSNIEFARQWLQKYPDANSYAQEIAGGAYRADSVRGGQAPDGDFNRVFSTVTRATGVTNADDAMKRANSAMDAIKRMARAGINPHSAPTIYKLANDSGWNEKHADPAYQVQLFYQLSKTPAALREMQGLLQGGSGKGNPSRAPSGGVAVNFANFPTVSGGEPGAPRPGGRTHKGRDFATPSGTVLFAPMPFKVIERGQDALAGRFVRVQFQDGSQHSFAHLSAWPKLDEGGVGAPMGRTGKDKDDHGGHVHVRSWVNGREVDPDSYFKRG